MARLLIRQAHGGETRIIGDGALPYFQSQGYVVLDDYDDSTDDPPLYLSKAESDLRYARLADLGDPESAEGVIIAGAAVDAVEDATTVAPVGAWNFTQTPTVGGVPVGSGSGVVAAADITDSTTVGRSVLTAADAAAARTAIGAGTSSLALGTTSTTAKAGNYTPPIADQPAGTLSAVVQNGDGTWPNRRTSRTDITGMWLKIVAGSADPPSATSPAVNGAYPNDIVIGV